MEKEIWKNSSRGMTLINVYDHDGKEIQKMVRAGKTIEVTERERLHLNTDRALTPGNDVFSAGFMIPVDLPDSTSDKAAIESNPNQLTEAALLDLLGLAWQKFDKALAEITNIQGLTRLYDLAEADDSTTVRQLDSVKARILEVHPSHIFDD